MSHNKLLGKKRAERSDDEDSSSSSEKDKPQKSIFGTNQKEEEGFKTGLFGDLKNPPNKPVSLFGSTDNKAGGLFGSTDNKAGSLFGSTDNKTGSLFGSTDNKTGSLFGSTDNKTGSLFGSTDNKTGSLFGPTDNKTGSLFGPDSSKEGGLFSKGALFDFSQLSKKKENDDEGEGDDNIGKSNSPNPYDPEKAKESSNGFKKIYVKKVKKFYMFDKTENKYVSKDEGFVSIETHTDEETKKKFAVCILRNTIGTVLCECILNEKINKFNYYEKGVKHVAHFFFLMKVTNDKKEEKIVVENAKIPFDSAEEAKEFEAKYKEAIAFLEGKEEEKPKESTSA